MLSSQPLLAPSINNRVTVYPYLNRYLVLSLIGKGIQSQRNTQCSFLSVSPHLHPPSLHPHPPHSHHPSSRSNSSFRPLVSISWTFNPTQPQYVHSYAHHLPPPTTAPVKGTRHCLGRLWGTPSLLSAQSRPQCLPGPGLPPPLPTQQSEYSL